MKYKNFQDLENHIASLIEKLSDYATDSIIIAVQEYINERIELFK